MATTIIDKGALRLEGNTLTIFSQSGFVDGDKWVLNLLGGAFVQVDPAPAAPLIEQALAADEKAGKLDRVDHILVDPNTGLRLFLEGRIGLEDIERARVTAEEVTFYPRFRVGADEGRYPVVVSPRASKVIMTVDCDGRIV